MEASRGCEAAVTARSSALVRRHLPFGFIIVYRNRSGAETGALGFAQRRALGGNGFFFLFPPNN